MVNAKSPKYLKGENLSPVKVTIGATKDLKQRSVTYQVKCQKDGKCKITEIFERGKPFTKKMSKCLDDFYRTEIKK